MALAPSQVNSTGTCPPARLELRSSKTLVPASAMGPPLPLRWTYGGFATSTRGRTPHGLAVGELLLDRDGEPERADTDREALERRERLVADHLPAQVHLRVEQRRAHETLADL